MANLSPDQGSGATEPIDPIAPQPATHGQVHAHPRLVDQMRKHLAQHVEHANTTRDYGGHGIAFSSGGQFTGSGMSGGAAGADYETESVGDTPDADSQGPTGY
jgi:hypothetical protein